VVGQDLVYAGRDFPTRSGTVIVLHTNSDFGCVASASIGSGIRVRQSMRLNVHLHEGHPRTSLLKSVAGDALPALNLILLYSINSDEGIPGWHLVHSSLQTQLIPLPKVVKGRRRDQDNSE